MSKYIVCVFDDDNSVYEGAKALRALDEEGSIAVFEGAILAKDDSGAVKLLDEASEAPLATLGGMLLGSFIGVLAGPVGMVVGAAAGTLSGNLMDAYNVGVGDDFLVEVGKELTPGKFALVAEVEEGWTAPLDTRMEALGGSVLRTWRIDFEDEQIERDIEANQREWEELKQEWREASDEAKAKLQANVEAVQVRLETLSNRAKEKLDSMKQEADAKLKKFDEQIAKAGAEAKARYTKYREDYKADYERRSAKLRDASQLAREALAA